MLRHGFFIDRFVKLFTADHSRAEKQVLRTLYRCGKNVEAFLI